MAGLLLKDGNKCARAVYLLAACFALLNSRSRKDKAPSTEERRQGEWPQTGPVRAQAVVYGGARRLFVKAC